METLIEAAPLIMEGVKEGVKLAKAVHTNKKNKQQVAKQTKVVTQDFQKRVAAARKREATMPPVAVGIKSLGGTGRYARSGDKSGLNLRVVGSDYLATVAVPTSTGSGDTGNVVYVIDISPLALANTRLSTDARTFEFYRFEKCDVRFTPTVGTQTGGSLVGFFDLNQKEALPTQGGENNLRIGLTHAGKSVFRVWEPAVIKLPPQTQVAKFFVDPNSGDDPRLTTQAKFYLLLETPIASGTVLGTLEIDYDVHFSVAQFSATPLSGEMSVVLNTNTGVSALIPFGTGAKMASYSTLGIEISPSTNLLTFPGGTYLMTLAYTASSNPTFTPVGLSVLPVKQVIDVSGEGLGVYNIVVGTPGATLQITFSVSITDPCLAWFSMFPVGMTLHKKKTSPSFVSKEEVMELMQSFASTWALQKGPLKPISRAMSNNSNSSYG